MVNKKLLFSSFPNANSFNTAFDRLGYWKSLALPNESEKTFWVYLHHVGLKPNCKLQYYSILLVASLHAGGYSPTSSL